MVEKLTHEFKEPQAALCALSGVSARASIPSRSSEKSYAENRASTKLLYANLNFIQRNPINHEPDLDDPTPDRLRGIGPRFIW